MGRRKSTPTAAQEQQRHLPSAWCNDINNTLRPRHFLFKHGGALVDVTLLAVRDIRRLNDIYIYTLEPVNVSDR